MDQSPFGIKQEEGWDSVKSDAIGQGIMAINHSGKGRLRPFHPRFHYGWPLSIDGDGEKIDLAFKLRPKLLPPGQLLPASSPTGPGEEGRRLTDQIAQSQQATFEAGERQIGHRVAQKDLIDRLYTIHHNPQRG